MEVYHADPGDPRQGQPYDSWLVVGLPSGVASVWVHRVETANAFFGLRDTRFFGDLFGGTEVTPVEEGAFPKLLHPGESLTLRNPWSFFSPVRETHGHATLRVFFSATEHSSLRDVDMRVTLPAPSATTWEELAAILSGGSEGDDRERTVQEAGPE